MGIFKSKKNDLAAGPDVPVDQVIAMKNQGYSNNQVIQTLQRDGYTSGQIFDAISQAELSNKQPASPADPNAYEQPISPQFQSSLPPAQMQPMNMMPPAPAMQPQQQFISGQPSTEEMVEAIIDEKWNDLVKDINKVIEWKQKTESKIILMDQQMTELRTQFDKLHQAIIGKVGEYDKHMLEVGAELQAMEKVFSKVLPTFVDNVNELNRITEKMKTPSSQSPKKPAKQPAKQQDEEE